jgi:hypothetical protein
MNREHWTVQEWHGKDLTNALLAINVLTLVRR